MQKSYRKRHERDAKEKEAIVEARSIHHAIPFLRYGPEEVDHGQVLSPPYERRVAMLACSTKTCNAGHISQYKFESC